MAFGDYGAIVFKGGKRLTETLFTNMKDCVGWEDTNGDIDIFNEVPVKFKDSYYTYIGDRLCVLAFYKNTISYIERNEEDDHMFYKENVDFCGTKFKWSKYEDIVGRDNFTVKKRNGYYVLRWRDYKVYFGYGVDIDSYKKHHIVNYYRSIPFLFYKYTYKIKGWFRNWRFV